jgi:hypothetical protein
MLPPPREKRCNSGLGGGTGGCEAGLGGGGTGSESIGPERWPWHGRMGSGRLVWLRLREAERASFLFTPWQPRRTETDSLPLFSRRSCRWRNAASMDSGARSGTPCQLGCCWTVKVHRLYSLERDIHRTPAHWITAD